MQTSNLSKNLLRRQIRIRRNSIGEKVKQQHAKTVANFLIELPCFHKAKTVAIYHPFDGEMPTDEIAQCIWKARKLCYLPIITPVASQLSFAPLRQNSEYVKNKFGILEPNYQINELQPAMQLDLVITPLVAFDSNGNRLGMGAGYYDQTFAFLAKNSFKKPVMIGLAYSFQEQAALNPQSWDIPLSAVITEEKVHNFRL